MSSNHPKHAKHDAKQFAQQKSLKQTFADIKRGNIPTPPLWSIAIAVLLLAAFCLVGYQVTTAAGWTVRLNDTVNEWTDGIRSSALNMAVIPLTTLGDLIPMGTICLLVLIFLAIRHRWGDVLFFAGNVIAGVLIVQVLKRIFAVSRPQAPTLVDLPASFSFPSAHTACSLIVLGLFALLIIGYMQTKNAAAPAQVAVFAIFMIIAILIGLSRIYVGVHWPTDVLGGWLFGAAWLIPTSAAYLRKY